MNELLDEITRTSIRLMLKEPFYGHYFSTINRQMTDKVSSIGMAVAGQSHLTLYVNPPFWKQVLTTEDYRYGALKHEILHIVFKHILMTHKFEFKDLANIAMDMAVNQYIDHEQLPLSPVIIDNYPDLNLKKDKDVNYYYHKLLTVYKRKGPVNSLLQLQLDLEKFNQNNLIGDHRFWEPLDASQQKNLENNINQMTRSVLERSKKNTAFGLLPAGLKAYLQSIEQNTRPSVNWRRMLRLFATSSQRTYLKNTIRRPSRRYGSIPGIKVKHKNKLLVAIDTSASVSNQDLAAFFGEIHHIFRQGAEIMIVECDTHIQKQYLYRGKTPQFITGRGGTDFNAPLLLANKNYQPDAIVYFTDGAGSSPKIIPRAPILWMLTPDGINEDTWDELPGRKVRLNHKTTIYARAE